MGACVFQSEIETQELEIGNLLTWVTVTEIDNEKFIIQKSDGGFNYATTDLSAIQHRIEEENANWIIRVSQSFQKKIMSMIPMGQGIAPGAEVAEKSNDFIKQMVQAQIGQAVSGLPFTNEKLKEEVAQVLNSITSDYFDLADSIPDSTSTSVAGEKTGYKDGCYEISSTTEMKKKK